MAKVRTKPEGPTACERLSNVYADLRSAAWTEPLEDTIVSGVINLKEKDRLPLLLSVLESVLKRHVKAPPKQA